MITTGNLRNSPIHLIWIPNRISMAFLSFKMDVIHLFRYDLDSSHLFQLFRYLYTLI